MLSLLSEAAQNMSRTLRVAAALDSSGLLESLPLVGVARNKYVYWMSFGDARVDHWPLMATPWPTLAIAAAYLAACLYGPRIMQNRKAIALQPLLWLYNLLTTAVNLYIGLELLLTSRHLTYSWVCEPVNYSASEPHAVRIAAALWWYYASKGIEMLDSVFFILRKKVTQLTFLHVYHHCSMFVLWWIGVKFVPGGSSFLGAMFNSFVHVLMYFYYFLSSVGVQPRFLWWKKYLTLIQMAQFTFALVMGVNAIYVGCDFPLWMQYALVAYMISFLILFGDFYVKAYVRNNKRKVL